MTELLDRIETLLSDTIQQQMAKAAGGNLKSTKGHPLTS